MCRPEACIALKWPDERLKRVCVSLKASRAFREMDRLVKRRGAIPSEVWGADPRCRESRREGLSDHQGHNWLDDW